VLLMCYVIYRYFQKEKENRSYLYNSATICNPKQNITIASHEGFEREIRERAIMSVVCAVDCANVKYLLQYFLWLLRELTARNMKEADGRSLMKDPPQRACNAGSSA